MLRPHTPLFDVASDPALEGGAAAAPAVETPAVPKKPGVIAQAMALINGAGANAVQIAQLRADLTAREASVADLTAQLTARDATIADLNAQISRYQADETALKQAIEKLEAGQKDFDDKVQRELVHQLATSGLDPEKLPKPPSAKAEQETLTFEAFQALDHPERNAFIRRGGKILHGSN